MLSIVAEQCDNPHFIFRGLRAEDELLYYQHSCIRQKIGWQG